MKKTLTLLILTIGQFSFTLAQSKSELIITQFDTTIHKRIYHVGISNYQLIELIELQGNKFEGTLFNIIGKVDKKEQVRKNLIQYLKIPPHTVEKLMGEVYKESIETLPSCKDVKGCKIGVDGMTITFGIKTDSIERNYSYWEPENDHYQNSHIDEIIKVRNIIKSIKSEIDLQFLFNQYKDSLPVGRYTYGMVIMKKS